MVIEQWIFGRPAVFQVEHISKICMKIIDECQKFKKNEKCMAKGDYALTIDVIH